MEAVLDVVHVVEEVAHGGDIDLVLLRQALHVVLLLLLSAKQKKQLSEVGIELGTTNLGVVVERDRLHLVDLHQLHARSTREHAVQTTRQGEARTWYEMSRSSKRAFIAIRCISVAPAQKKPSPNVSMSITRCSPAYANGGANDELRTTQLGRRFQPWPPAAAKRK